MNCENFQTLLADALGGELSDADRPNFEAHIASCSQCRREYESMSGALHSLQSLPEPQPLSVRRIGDSLILGVHPDTPLHLRGVRRADRVGRVRGQGEGVVGCTPSVQDYARDRGCSSFCLRLRMDWRQRSVKASRRVSGVWGSSQR